MAVSPPEPVQASGEPERGDSIKRILKTTLKGRPQVVVLTLQANKPHVLIWADECRPRRFCERQAPISVTSTDSDLLAFLAQPLICVLAKRFEHSITHTPGFRRLGHHKRLID
jgi:hypothetical protein